MRITFKYSLGQSVYCHIFLIFLLYFLSACSANRNDAVIPPVTAPLSKDYIGYGVITDSFTHVMADPSETSESLGYLRRGSLVRIVRRRAVKVNNVIQSWVLTDDIQQGWLKESVMDVYDTEGQARTASQALVN